MNDLVITSEQALSACRITTKNLALLRNIEPTWGMFDPDGDWQRGEVTRPVPDPPTLDAMANELAKALRPASAHHDGERLCTQAALTLIESYPQRDTTGQIYAQQVVRRLMDCPPALLPQVIDRLVDTNPDFRPGVGRVAEAVRGVTASLKIAHMRVEAARRWWATAEKENRKEPSSETPRAPGQRAPASRAPTRLGAMTPATE